MKSSSAEANKQSHKGHKEFILVRPFPHGSPTSSPQATLGISLTKGRVPLKDNTTPSTPAGLLLFPEQEGSPLLLQTLVVFE
ncbi:hypothetical protein Taro_017967, partial [Colocasia esculenta]|nr:hypothetical protein [Colocasia esculenta]